MRLPQQILRSRLLPGIVIGLTLAILATTIYLGTTQLRGKIRVQIAGRDAAILHAVALMQQLNHQEEAGLGGQLENVADQMDVALEITQLFGVIATRLFDARGQFTTPFPGYVVPGNLGPEDLVHLQQLKPVSHFHPKAKPRDLFLPNAQVSAALERSVPLLEVIIPLHRKDDARLLGAAQFVIDGESIAAEFVQLDRNLLLQGTLAFVVGGVIVFASLTWAFRRLQRAGRLLVDRTERLAKANEELALVAKTSAVGAVTAHLVHRLSNPLSGLQDFVAAQGQASPPDSDWQDAVATAAQMQELIAEVIRLLGEEQAIEGYEIGLRDWIERVEARIKPVATAAGVHLAVESSATTLLGNREANLLALVMDNLLRNAIEATPAGKKVQLLVRSEPAGLAFEVTDEGSGLPENVRTSLFQPRHSSKPGGHGIGLAICKQLASHLGAGLELKQTGPRGSVFRLDLTTSTKQSQHRLAGNG